VLTIGSMAASLARLVNALSVADEPVMAASMRALTDT
jgi:hypothetical protein